MIIILPPRELYDVLRELCKFLERSDNISLTVRDGDMVAIKH